MLLLPFQAAYRDNTLGLPRMLIDHCEDDTTVTSTGYEEITAVDVRQFVASHFTPDRMVLTGIGVDHTQFVELAEEHFSNANTTWSSGDVMATDGSTSQYTGGHCKVCRLCVTMETINILCVFAIIMEGVERCCYIIITFHRYILYTVEPLKGHNTFNLSIKDKFCGPYRTMVIQFYLLKRTTSV